MWLGATLPNAATLKRVLPGAAGDVWVLDVVHD
jgi:hypothetical protein